MLYYQKTLFFSIFIFLNFPFVFATETYPPLQPLIDSAKPNDTLIIPTGIYAGPIVLNFPLTLDGNAQVTIDGGGKNSVIYINTDGAQLRNVHLTNSGDSHDQTDACIQVRGNFNIIKDNILDNCLFGIDLQQSSNNVIRRNRIRSKDKSLGLRGDAIRLWYSMNNKVTDNEISDSRDMVVWYSKDNLIANNTSTGGRYALHFMYSQYNRVENNVYLNNSVGIFLMYSDGVKVSNNYIFHALGATGIGIGLKETSDVSIENNRIIYCATGIYSDLSPYEPDSENFFISNELAYNGIGVLFHNDWTGNIFEKNRFHGNHSQVSVQGASTAKRNLWTGNYWDDYVGFDRDRNNQGDTPYEIYAYSDQLWMDVKSARFFKATPLLEVLNFLERLAPFSEPTLVLQDDKPIFGNE